MSRPEELVRWLGGVARTSRLIDRGIRRRAIGEAVTSGALLRVRKGWVAVPEADADLMAAARAGVVLTCVTQARRIGLWVLGDDAPHLAAPAHAGHVGVAGAVLHWGRPLVPRHPDSLTDEIENVLAIVAACQPYEVALAIWESALRQRLVDSRALARLDFGPEARRIREEADPFADSGLETFVVPRLRWMRLPLRRQIWIAGRPVDLLIGDRLVLQIDGGHHVGAQREADIAHDAELALLGYHVIRVGYGAVVNDWPAVQARLMRAVAQGIHLAP
ncbi:endonuclease domain-containing protein [Microbacterium sp. A1-JK]|uniref:endonuclease domain-containing protein n=1 Tax=Microbacterium sp. A1-JK TaxID=3177516 RepID=UPI0038845A00